jgi:hypothetical protein
MNATLYPTASTQPPKKRQAIKGELAELLRSVEAVEPVLAQPECRTHVPQIAITP